MGPKLNLSRIGSRLSPGTFRRLVNLATPMRNSGVKVVHISPDWQRWTLRLRLSRKTRNYVGTHYGGTLYSSMDPHFMLAWMHILGRDHIVWDKAATIRFRKPGRGTLRGSLEITDAEIAAVRSRCQTEPKVDVTHSFCWIDRDGNTVAEVEKVVQIRRKDS